MNRLHLANRTDQHLSLIIEPVADTYLIEPGSSVLIEADLVEGIPLEVDYRSENIVAVWTHALTSVYRDGALLTSE